MDQMKAVLSVPSATPRHAGYLFRATEAYGEAYRVGALNMAMSTVLLTSSTQTISAYTERGPAELVDFILGHVDREEREWLLDDLLRAMVQSWKTHSFEPLGEVLRDWEETVAIKLDPVLSRELDAAFEEADTIRESEQR